MTQKDGFSSDERIKVIEQAFKAAGLAGVVIVMDDDEVSWLPVFPEGFGVGVNTGTDDLAVRLQLTDSEQVARALCLMNDLAQTACDVAETFARIVKYIQQRLAAKAPPSDVH